MTSNATDAVKGKKWKENQTRKLLENVNEKGRKEESGRTEKSDEAPLKKNHPIRKPSFKWYGTA